MAQNQVSHYTDVLGILTFLYATNAAHSCESGDCVVVLLGSPSPLVVTPQEGSWEVLSEFFFHGLSDATSVLGPLSPPWKVVGSWGDETGTCLDF